MTMSASWVDRGRPWDPEALESLDDFEQCFLLEDHGRRRPRQGAAARFSAQGPLRGPPFRQESTRRYALQGPTSSV